MTAVAALIFVSTMTGCRTEPEEPGATGKTEAVEFKIAETPEGLFQQAIDAFNSLSELLESVNDQPSADNAAKELDDKHTPRIKTIVERLKDIEDEIGVRALSDIADQFEDPGEEAMDRLYDQVVRLSDLDSDALASALERLEEAMRPF